MAQRVIIRKDSYHDSVFLMSLTQKLLARVVLEDAVVAMGAPHNKALLQQEGYQGAELEAAGPSDLIIAVRGAAERVDAIEGDVDALFHQEQQADVVEEARPASLAAALKVLPEANLALISLPGRYAAREAGQALARGLHVMLFSDNVALEDEIALKAMAVARGLLCMGPDCGTAMIAGRPLGFANVVRHGPVGVVGASGTGIQEVTSCIHRLGGGCSQIIGTGGRDLKKEVAGRTARFAIEALAKDGETQVIVFVSKPPAPEVAERVIATLQAADKPAVAHFVGAPARAAEGNVRFATTLAETAELACELAGLPVHAAAEINEAQVAALARKLGGGPSLLGLFCGGTTAYEALHLLKRAGLTLRSNLDHAGEPAHADGLLLDLGDDQYTQGRPHPMIEPTLRNEQLAGLLEEDHPTLLLFDVVLGYGSHADPAGLLAEGLSAIGREDVVAIASITGTADDPQGYVGSRQRLERAGVIVMEDNRRAAELAAAVMQRSAR